MTITAVAIVLVGVVCLIVGYGVGYAQRREDERREQ